MKQILLAGVSALLILAPLNAYARDEVLCDRLNTIMSYAKTGFRAVSGKSDDGVTSAAIISLPDAYQCYIMPDDAGAKYVCEFHASEADIQAKMTSFADNLGSCYPKIKRKGFNEDGARYISLDSSLAKISMSFTSIYPDQFSLFIQRAE